MKRKALKRKARGWTLVPSSAVSSGSLNRQTSRTERQTTSRGSVFAVFAVLNLTIVTTNSDLTIILSTKVVWGKERGLTNGWKSSLPIGVIRDKIHFQFLCSIGNPKSQILRFKSEFFNRMYH